MLTENAFFNITIVKKLKKPKQTHYNYYVRPMISKVYKPPTLWSSHGVILRIHILFKNRTYLCINLRF